MPPPECYRMTGKIRFWKCERRYLRSHFLLSGIWHLALASGIGYMIYAFTSLSHFEHVHIYWHVHMFTCSHFYHIWKCERRYVRSHSWVKVVEPNDFPRGSTFSALPFHPHWTLNIWTFEHLNIWILDLNTGIIQQQKNAKYGTIIITRSLPTFIDVHRRHFEYL